MPSLGAHGPSRASSSTRAGASIRATSDSSTASRSRRRSACCSTSRRCARPRTTSRSMIHAARRKRLITYESTHETFDRHARRGLKGVAALRDRARALESRRSRPTESEMETLLLQALRDHGLPEPVLQFEVRDARGTLVGRVDAAYPDALHRDRVRQQAGALRRVPARARRAATERARRRSATSRCSARGTRTSRRGGDELCDQIDSDHAPHDQREPA